MSGYTSCDVFLTGKGKLCEINFLSGRYFIFRTYQCYILIRIRIRGYVPLSNGSGSVSCYFRQWPSRREPTIYFNFFCLLFFKLHLLSFSKIKSHKKVTKHTNQDFSPDPYLDPRGPKTYESSGSGSGSATLVLTYIFSFMLTLQDTVCKLVTASMSTFHADLFTRAPFILE